VSLIERESAIPLPSPFERLDRTSDALRTKHLLDAMAAWRVFRVRDNSPRVESLRECAADLTKDDLPRCLGAAESHDLALLSVRKWRRLHAATSSKAAPRQLM